MSIYTTGEYLDSNPTWHAEDSAWKADQIYRILAKNDIHPRTVSDVGCGAGSVLVELSRRMGLSSGTKFRGYDISPQAIELAATKSSEQLEFFCEDIFLGADSDALDVLLVIDVFEHVPDYMGFVSKCRQLAKYKVYHIPLEIHVSSVLRDNFERTRQKIGHLHSFTASTAIATLRDTGHEIVDQFYTNGALVLFDKHPSLRRAVANAPRWLLSKLSVPLTARLLGGYSLLVLAK